MPKLKFYAFWKYDTFPFVCGGEVTNIGKDGLVETKEYGPGYWFQPFKIVGLAQGKEMAQKLKMLTYEKMEAEAKLRKEFVDKRNKIITIPL